MRIFYLPHTMENGVLNLHIGVVAVDTLGDLNFGGTHNMRFAYVRECWNKRLQLDQTTYNEFMRKNQHVEELTKNYN